MVAPTQGIAPFKVRANPVNIRQTSDRFVERPRLQHDDREELTDSGRCTYQKPPGRPMVWRHRRRCILYEKRITSYRPREPNTDAAMLRQPNDCPLSPPWERARACPGLEPGVRGPLNINQ